MSWLRREKYSKKFPTPRGGDPPTPKVVEQKNKVIWFRWFFLAYESDDFKRGSFWRKKIWWKKLRSFFENRQKIGRKFFFFDFDEHFFAYEPGYIMKKTVFFSFWKKKKLWKKCSEMEIFRKHFLSRIFFIFCHCQHKKIPPKEQVSAPPLLENPCL